MNTIVTNSPVQLAMEGQSYTSKVFNRQSVSAVESYTPVTPDGSKVAQNIEDSIAKIKADSQELQKMASSITGRKLQFNINKELNSVVVTIVDSNTNKVLKQIPSEDIQNLKLRIRKVIGNIFDEMV